MSTNLKKANINKIIDFAQGKTNEHIQGSKLFALLKLIDKKGEEITTEDEKLKGQKALELKNGLWIAYRKTTFKNSFFMLKTYLLEAI